MNGEYSFVTRWAFEAPLERVWTVIRKNTDWPTWWRGVISVNEISKGDTEGVGAVSDITWRSALPYTLTFRVEVTTVEPYKVLEGKAFGELEGTGKWVFESKENTTFVTYFWNVRTNKFWMRNMDFLLRPLFKWNHDIVMNWGYEGLRKKL